MFFATAEVEPQIERAVDEYGDSFARDVDVDELKEVRYFSVTLRLVGNLPAIRLSTLCLQILSTALVLKI